LLLLATARAGDGGRPPAGDLSIVPPLADPALVPGIARCTSDRACTVTAAGRTRPGTPLVVALHEARRGQPLRRSRSISRAALYPHAPITPPPGWAAAPQR